MRYKLAGPYPHEIHITVDPTSDPSRFEQTCKDLHLKPVLVKNIAKNKQVYTDLLTSQTLMSNSAVAMQTMAKTALALESRGYKIVRKKIETAPTHITVPTIDNGFPATEASVTYFESHIKVVELIDGEFPEDRIEVSAALGHIMRANPKIHLSVTYAEAFAKIKSFIFTIRDRNTVLEVFKNQVETFSRTLSGCGFHTRSPEIEFAIYDSNINHDLEWMKPLASKL
jgi:hypothetical protein